MSTMTYSAIKTKVENDLDLIDEDFITDDEMLGYCNEGIAKAESIIHTLYEDYFLTSANLSMVSGTASYVLPTDVYAVKIRTILYDSAPAVPGGVKYEIRRVKHPKEISFLKALTSGTIRLRYLPTNSLAGGQKLTFYPTPNETSSTYVTIWYIRDAKRMALDADTCDIPEFVEYVIQFMKARCYEKEGHPNLGAAAAYLKELEQEMIDTLKDMVPDEDTEIDQDLTFYDDFDDKGII